MSFYSETRAFEDTLGRVIGSDILVFEKDLVLVFT